MATRAELAGLLRDLLASEGPDLPQSRAKLLTLLRERVPDDPRAVHLLVTAAESGVPGRLREGTGPLAPAEIAQEADRMAVEFGSDPERAREAIAIWAEALGRELPAAAQVPAAQIPPAPLLKAEPSGLLPVETGVASALPPQPAAPIPFPAAATPHRPSPGPRSGGAAAPPLPLPAGTNPPPPSPPAPLPLPPASPPLAALPTGGGAGPILPLPLPSNEGLMPLPTAGLPPIGGNVMPLPGNSGPVAGYDLPQATGPRPRKSMIALRFVIPVAALAIAGGIWAFGGWRFWFSSGVQPQPGGGPSRPGGPTPRPQTGGPGTTPEGFPIATVDNPPKIRGEKIDNDPNTLLFTFGLRFPQGVYTYQAAVAFTGSDADGIGLIKAVSGGREASTGQIKVTRALQPNGYAGFTMSAAFAENPISAPAICVSALAGKSASSLDVSNGGGTFCAFATSATGICNGDIRHGCGDLVP